MQLNRGLDLRGGGIREGHEGLEGRAGEKDTGFEGVEEPPERVTSHGHSPFYRQGPGLRTAHCRRKTCTFHTTLKYSLGGQGTEGGDLDASGEWLGGGFFCKFEWLEGSIMWVVVAEWTKILAR